VSSSGRLHLIDEAALVQVASDLARAQRPLAIALRGPLGAGKTALARALLRSLGHVGAVRSPTYTLVECYPLPTAAVGTQLWHLDLYRLGSSEEVDWLGLVDFDPSTDWLLVEWPDRGEGHLPAFDLLIDLDYAEPGRTLFWRALEPAAAGLIRADPGNPA
jgi:tRNA threonylcarbamoyladenosine biosynthesis protein TsaE